jgi:hypothetical protein
MSVQFPKKPSSPDATTTVAQPKTPKQSTASGTRHTGVADRHEDPHAKAPDALGTKPRAGLQAPRSNVKGRVSVPSAPPMERSAASDGASQVLGKYETAPGDRQENVLNALSDFNQMIEDTYGMR